MRDDFEYEYDDEPYVVIEQSSGVGPFLIGLALGAGAALLLAPRTGRDLRDMLGDRARDVRDTARRMVDDVTDTVTDQVDEFRSAARRGKRHVEDAIDAGREAAEDARSELERKIAEQKASFRNPSYPSEPTA